ncbi:AMP-binding protein [Streptomyces ziwulingensis]|uniref:AMP-dependent synthetase/ligase domain-containing protein n=1 Tax=Streptomyces ziwulingensis TaxID=1045501 RepID=A0ABP9CL53_9ACTN
MTATTLAAGPVHELVGRQEERASGRLAVRSPVEQFTYRELVRSAHDLSRRLTALSPRPEAPVGVCLPPGPRFVAATLAVLESGGAALPIDPGTPPDRVESILASARATTCLTDGDGGGGRPASPSPAAEPMVVSRRGQWVAQMREAQLVCPLAPGDTMLHAAAFGTPDAVMEMFWPLCAGATVVAHEATDPMSRLLACQRIRATVMVLPVDGLGEFMDFQRDHGLLPPPWLRLVVCTGGPPSDLLGRRFAQQIGRHGCRLHSVAAPRAGEGVPGR